MTENLITSLLRLHKESVSRERLRTDLIDFATYIMSLSGLMPAIHHRLLLGYLAQVADGKIKRLLVLMPPGSAKSTYASVIFPIWWFIQHPQSSVIATSHTAALVEHFSRRIRTLIFENSHKIGVKLRSDDSSVSNWKTTAGGEYFATGVRGAITGRRADLVIIDDPVKSMGEADSAKHRQHVWDWYTAELMTRLKPEARIVVVMTRWHDQDLGGRLIASDNDDWQVVRLPAVAENIDPIGRPPGAPLWPAWESLDALARKQSVVGSRVWSALFQQSPRPVSGRLFSVEQLQIIERDQLPSTPVKRIVRAWDLASTPMTEQQDPDWTVGLRLAVDETGRYVVDNIVRFRAHYRTVRDTILSTARTDGHSVIVSLPIDPGQAGKSQVAELSSILSGYRVYTSREIGSKLSRATLIAAQVEANNVVVKREAWTQTFLDELMSFPQGAKDDQVDALSRAYITLLDFHDSGRRLFVPFNAR